MQWDLRIDPDTGSVTRVSLETGQRRTYEAQFTTATVAWSEPNGIASRKAFSLDTRTGALSTRIIGVQESPVLCKMTA